MWKVVKDTNGQYAVWKYINDHWERMSQYFWAETTAISLMKTMATIMK